MAQSLSLKRSFERLRSVVSALLVVLLLSSFFVLDSSTSSAQVSSSASTPFGFTGIPVTSPDGVRYTFYSGKTGSFDGLPLSADVTIPANIAGPLPLIVMFHGWTQSKTYWESQTITNSNPDVSNWNNVAFASKGYAVLNYTIRGWHDSCGPDSATVKSDPTTLPPECSSRQYWVHLADPRWEIHDAQYLIGKLVDEGVANPEAIGVTGESYGGGHSWLLAELNDRTVNLDGSVVPWQSPGGIPLHIKAAAPKYTWSDLWNALLPNGRANDTDTGSPSLLDTSPVGVPIQSYTDALYAVGQPAGNAFYSPPGVDPSSDLTTWNARLIAGNPFNPTDPILARAIQEYQLRSPLFLTPHGTVPIYQMQGLTDPLFPPVQAVMMRNHVLAYNSSYPIKSFFGDIGHSNANNPADVWSVANSIGQNFFDFYLKGSGRKPTFDVTAMTTTCVAGQTRQTFSAPSFQALSSSKIVLSSNLAQVTSDVSAGPEGAATDPITQSGCQSTLAYAGSGVASWNFPVTSPFTLMGQPTLTANFVTTGVDAELNVRIWDVAPDGQNETLVSRGTYRYVGAAGSANQVTFQVSANAWQFQAGHTLRLEIVGNDAPYYQSDNVPAITTINTINLALPLR